MATTNQLVQRLKDKIFELLDSNMDRTDEVKNLSEALSNVTYVQQDEKRNKEAKNGE